MHANESNWPAVVFLHGIGGAAGAWAPQETSFSAAGFAPVALDLPGYGSRSPVTTTGFRGACIRPRNRRSRSGICRARCWLVIRSAEWLRRPRCAAARTDTARRCCVAQSPAFGDPGGAFQRKFVADRLGPLDAGKTLADLAADNIDNILGPEPDPAGRALAIAIMAAAPVDTYRAAVRCLVAFDERANLAGIRIPVLCLSGEHDRNAPPQMMERMASKIPGARYVCLPRMGHLPNLEAPAAFDAAVLDFLRHALPART